VLGKCALEGIGPAAGSALLEYYECQDKYKACLSRVREECMDKPDVCPPQQ